MVEEDHRLRQRPFHETAEDQAHGDGSGAESIAGEHVSHEPGDEHDPDVHRGLLYAVGADDGEREHRRPQKRLGHEADAREDLGAGDTHDEKQNVRKQPGEKDSIQ